MEELNFIFDGRRSDDMNLKVVRFDEGFIETPYWGSSSIQEKQSKKKLVPNFYGISREPIEFTVQFALIDEFYQPKQWTPEERNRIADWLIQDTYKEFQPINSFLQWDLDKEKHPGGVDDISKRYYAICINEGMLNLINSEGYVELTFRTNSPFAWSPVYFDEFDFSNRATETKITLYNNSNVVKLYNPKIQVQVGPTGNSFSLKNNSHGGRVMKFTDLLPNEIISIDTENRVVKSNIAMRNPFGHFNVDGERYWMELVRGANEIVASGKCKIWVKSQFPIAQ